jgi:deoxyribonuclease-4
MNKELDHFINKYKFINTTFYYGSHMSVSHNIIHAIKEIEIIGGNCLQIFVSSPMSGQVSEKSYNYYYDNGKKIQDLLIEKNIKLFIHSPYTFNFAKNICKNDWSSCFWVRSYMRELEIAHNIGATGCVIHVGKSIDLTIEEATENMYNSLSYIIEHIHKNKLESVIILETGAGQGTEMFLTENNSLDNFANFYNRFSKKQKKYIKICVDTCHIYSAGYKINTAKQCVQFFNEFDEKIGLDYLILIHLNESKREYNAHVDRHANLGQGDIGSKGISSFIMIAYMLNIPLILETPEADPKQILAIKEIELIKKIKKKVSKRISKKND